VTGPQVAGGAEGVGFADATAEGVVGVGCGLAVFCGFDQLVVEVVFEGGDKLAVFAAISWIRLPRASSNNFRPIFKEPAEVSRQSESTSRWLWASILNGEIYRRNQADPPRLIGS